MHAHGVHHHHACVVPHVLYNVPNSWQQVGPSRHCSAGQDRPRGKRAAAASSSGAYRLWRLAGRTCGGGWAGWQRLDEPHDVRELHRHRVGLCLQQHPAAGTQAGRHGRVIGLIILLLHHLHTLAVCMQAAVPADEKSGLSETAPVPTRQQHVARFNFRAAALNRIDDDGREVFGLAFQAHQLQTRVHTHTHDIQFGLFKKLAAERCGAESDKITAWRTRYVWLCHYVQISGI